MINIEQGTDVALTVNVLNESGGLVDVQAVNEVYAVLSTNGNVVAKFATTPPSGWQPLTVTGTNTIKLLLEHTNTATYPVGTYAISVVTDSTDGDFPSGRRDEYPQLNAFTVVDGKAKTIQS